MITQSYLRNGATNRYMCAWKMSRRDIPVSVASFMAFWWFRKVELIIYDRTFFLFNVIIFVHIISFDESWTIKILEVRKMRNMTQIYLNNTNLINLVRRNKLLKLTLIFKIIYLYIYRFIYLNYAWSSTMYKVS